MKTKSLKNANYIGWLVIVIAFLFIYFTYFFIYIPKKEALIQQKGFRILNEYGSNMLDKHRYFETHFRNYGFFYSIKYLLDSGIIVKRDKIEIDVDKALKIENVLKGLQTYVITSENKSNLTYYYDETKKELFLSFKFKNNDPVMISDFEKFYRNKIEDTTFELILDKDFSYNVPISYFMQNLKFDELFENIILFDTSKVYYSTKSGNLSVVNNPKALCDSVKSQQGGVYEKLNINGKDQHVMLYPVDFAGKKFCIAGFIPDVDYQNKTRTINKQLLLFIATILMLVFASMPILKIFFIDDRERLKARDATSSAISMLFGIGLFILLIIAFSKKQFVDATIQHRRIHAISDSLCANIMRDFDSIKTLGKTIVRAKKSGDAILANKVITAFNSTLAFTQDSNLSSPFPLNEIILMDKDGIVKMGYTSTPFSDIVKVNLNERQYFKSIKNVNNSWPTSDGYNIYIESIKSFNTTKYETAISFRTTNPELPVLAITSRIPSLYNQVLPGDIEFVVINKTGRVLYHSIQEKNLHENFVLECESDLSLINAIRLQTEDETLVNYNEKKWLARIKPINETPFFHVTLLDLNQADTKNARIFLITFYFLIVSIGLMIIGLLLLKWITRSFNDKQKHKWFLNWLVFKPSKHFIYQKLSGIFLLIILFQLFGFLFADNPVSQFVYQLIFLTFTLFLSMVFLNITETELIETAWFKFFSEFLVLLAILFLIVTFFFVNRLAWIQIIPLGALIGIVIFNNKFFKKDYLQKLIVNNINDLSGFNAKRTYLIFLFLFLTSISGIPVLRYYFSVKNMEESHWRHEQFLKVGNDNIKLLSDPEYKATNDDWFKKIQGNELDNLEIKFLEGSANFETTSNSRFENSGFAKQLYDLLPDPITNWYNQPKLLVQSDYIVSKLRNDTLYFKKGEQTGAVKIKYADHKRFFTILNYIFLIFFVLLIICFSVWYLLKFLAKVLLNLNQEKPAVPDDSWLEILRNKDVKRILLKSFNGQVYLSRSKEYFDSAGDNKYALKIIQVSEIVEQDFQCDPIFKSSALTIWICGFNQILYEIKEHEKLLAFLTKLNQCSQIRIIVDLSFDNALINEFYDDYIAENELTPKQATQLYLLRKKWNSLFNGYIIYNGYIIQIKPGISGLIRVEDEYHVEKTGTALELEFSMIWTNLTSFEKIVLFDLADDGLLNRKNNILIQNLIDKRLIVTNPEPAFYSEDFCDFVLKNMRAKEVKAIENKLGLKGSWHNAKYLILLILVPLAAFIIISQGISIEKVFGIFAGGLAIITGIIRLFDSNTFKSSQ